MNWKNWLVGLLWAVLTGMGSGVVLTITDPVHFSFVEWRHLLNVCGSFGLIAFFAYLKDSRPKTDAMSSTWRTGVGTVLMAAGLGGLTLMLACTPKGVVLTPAGQKAYTSVQALTLVDDLSKTARNLNATVGKNHLSDQDTALVRDFALAAGTGLQDYGQGTGRLAVALDAYHVLNLKLSKEARLNDKFKFALGLVDGALNNIVP